MEPSGTDKGSDSKWVKALLPLCEKMREASKYLEEHERITIVNDLVLPDGRYVRIRDREAKIMADTIRDALEKLSNIPLAVLTKMDRKA